MTRLFNLESYSNLCTNTNLYACKSQIETPAAYKSFLDRYRQLGYRSDSLYPPELTVRDELMPLKYLGVNLSEDRDRLYVVGDRINSLSLRNFLKPGERYIYRSVYHYWNYRQQIANNLDLNRSVVFIDLGSLSNEPYCTLRFERSPNSPYLTPIIDNRREVSSDFKLALDIKNIHHNIYRDLAREILTRNFPQLANNNNTVEHLKTYLQKIEVFKLAQSQSEPGDFSIIVEISDREKIYYRSISLNISLLETIVVDRVNVRAILTFVQKHSKHLFILISDYNFLPKFREAFNSSNIFIPENYLTEFSQVWQEKQQQNFPLFGQYLDKIKFQIRMNNQIQWIEVLSTKEQEHIYYEGDPQTKRFIARIQNTGQEYFTLSYPDAVLPIQINDRDYCVNGKTQEYQILHPLSKPEPSLEKLKIRIDFIVKLGSVPELKVTDRENKYKIETKLQDYIEQKVSLNCVPLKTILEYREQQFKNKIPNVELCKKVSLSLASIVKINSFEQLPAIGNQIRSANETIRLSRRKQKAEPFLYVNPHLESLNTLNSSINAFFNTGVIDATIDYLKYSDKILSINSVVTNIFNLIGRTHQLSKPYIPNLFFNRQFIEKATTKTSVTYYTFLAKVAFKKEFQLAYFNAFYSVYKNKPCYQIKDYLWGYSRILLWYSEFYRQYQNKELDYLKHFKSITNYLLDRKMVAGSNGSKPYQQDSFLALIYLLTFREADSYFCARDSEEYQLAERVIIKYERSPVYLKTFGDRSLNQCFEELLKGNCSQESVRRIIEAD